MILVKIFARSVPQSLKILKELKSFLGSQENTENCFSSIKEKHLLVSRIFLTRIFTYNRLIYFQSNFRHVFY